jgi:hypothetical protein
LLGLRVGGESLDHKVVILFVDAFLVNNHVVAWGLICDDVIVSERLVLFCVVGLLL